MKEKHTKRLVNTVLVTLAALGMGAMAGNALADEQAKLAMEKCAGIVKAGLNDCGGSSAHACAGQSKTDGAKEDWIYVPKGACGKIVGGTVLEMQDKKK